MGRLTTHRNHKNHNLNPNKDLLIFLTSKLITRFIDGFPYGNETRIQLLIYQVATNLGTYIYQILRPRK